MAHEGYYSEASNLGNVNDLLNEAELYKDQANASAIAAADSAADAEATAASIVVYVDDAAASAVAAASSATDSYNSSINSSNSAVNSAASATASSNSANNSASSATTSASSATASASSATASEASAIASEASAAEAAATVASLDPSSFLTKAGNLAGLTDKVVSRENLGITSFAKNKMINGKMEIPQRGTSFATATSGAYPVDRWAIGYVSSAVVTTSQQSDAPSSAEFQYSARIEVTTADTSIAAGDFFHLSQRIEGYDARDLIGKPITLSFWVKSPKVGIHCVSLINSGADRSLVSEYTVSSANTWEKKSITIPSGLITTGTWNWLTGVGVGVYFALACGTTYRTTPDIWQTGNFIATSNQVNCLDTVGNIFAITGVQLEVGSVATPFEHRPIGQELALCQRYGELVTTGWITGFSSAISVLNLQWRVPKRVVPTLTLVAGGVGVGNGISIDITAISSVTASVDGAFMALTGGVAWTAAASYSWRVGSIFVSSEL